MGGRFRLPGLPYPSAMPANPLHHETEKMVKYALDGLDNNIQRQERRSGADAA